MYDGHDLHEVVAHSVHDAIVLEKPLAKVLALVFRHHSPQQRLPGYGFDQGQDAFPEKPRIPFGIPRDIPADAFQIIQRLR